MLHIQKAVIKLWLELGTDCITGPKYSLPFPIKGLINSTHCNVTCSALYRKSILVYLYLINNGLGHVLCLVFGTWETLHVPWPSWSFNSHCVVLPVAYSFPSVKSSIVLKVTDSSFTLEQRKHLKQTSIWSIFSHVSNRKQTWFSFCCCCKPLRFYGYSLVEQSWII